MIILDITHEVRNKYGLCTAVMADAVYENKRVEMTIDMFEDSHVEIEFIGHGKGSFYTKKFLPIKRASYKYENREIISQLIEILIEIFEKTY